jgi:dihydroneopterin aldolase
LNEDEVLKWLIEQKNSATIEEVTDEILEDLIEEYEYVVVYFSKYNLLLNVTTLGY